MIEQYTITNKYNFPQPTIDSLLPQRFFEQSIHSLNQVQHQPLQLNQQTVHQFNIAEQYPHNIQLKQGAITLKADHQETIVAAVDTSTIKIGETQTGIIVAIRGATTWKQNGTYKYTRLGPFIFHITEENKNQLYNTLEHAYFSTTYGSSHQVSAKHHADAHATRQPLGAVAANNACQNRKPRCPSLRWFLNRWYP